MEKEKKVLLVEYSEELLIDPTKRNIYNKWDKYYIKYKNEKEFVEECLIAINKFKKTVFERNVLLEIWDIYNKEFRFNKK